MLDIPAILDKDDVSSLLRVTPRTLERWIAEGHFPPGRRVGSRRGGRILWLREDVLGALGKDGSGTSNQAAKMRFGSP